MLLNKIVSVTILLVLLVSGCNPNTKEIQTKNVELVWFSDTSFWNPPTTWNTDENTVQGAITKATGVTFKMDIPQQDGDIQLNLMLVDGTLPDIITIVDSKLRDELIKSGRVWKMEELLQAYDPESHLLKDFPQDIKESLIHNNGDWYSFPSHMASEDMRSIYPPSCQYYLDIPTTRHNWNILFNGDIMEKAGITIDDLSTEAGVMSALEAVQAMNIVVDDKAVIPLLVDGSNYQDFALGYLMNTFGAMNVDADGNYRDFLLAPEAKHALKFMNTSVIKGYLDPKYLISDTEVVQEYIGDERVFCFIGNVADIRFDRTRTKNWVTPGAVVSVEGKTPVLGINRQAAAWMQTFVSKDCDYPELAAKWLSYMSSPEGLMLSIFGFEGVDYTVGEDGLINQTEIGLQNIMNYEQTGVQAYWPFHNIPFNHHVLPEPTDEHERLLMNVVTAFGKDPDTIIYDRSLLMIPTTTIVPGSDLGIAEDKINSFKEIQITKIVLAEDAESFEALYNELIDTMIDYGINDIDAVKNEVVQANYERYGKTLSSINGD